MHLSSFKITDFQSYRTTQELRLDRHITLLAGRNNVGKTALLRGLRLPVEPRPGIGPSFQAEYTWEATHEELAAALPGFLSALRAVGISQTRPRYTLWASLHPSGPITSSVGASPWIGNTGMVLAQSGLVDTPLRLALTEQAPGQTGARLQLGQRTWHLDWSGLSVPQDDYWNGLVQAWVQLIGSRVSGSYYVHPRRTGAQATPFGVVGRLEPDGSNLTNVVATLYVNHRYTIFEQLEAFMRSAFPEIARLDVQMDGSPVMATIRLVYAGPAGELIVPLEYCGTGIEQLLMLAAALLTADAPRLFLIDEPHAFLHPAAERSLLRLIRGRPEHQYVIATHSGVFLTAVPLGHVRLITIDGSGSRVNDVRHASEILAAVGVTAADLWSADALLWIEGPSDVDAVEEVIARSPDLGDANIRVLAMPDWIRSLAATEKKAAATVTFCESVREAVTPFKVPALFLFDADEKTEDLKARVEAATEGRARFLPVRELENLLLVPAAVRQVLADLCNKVGTVAPSAEEVAAEMERLLGDTRNHDLYKADPGEADPAKVVGAALLGRLWWRWAKAPYDKTAYGPELVRAVAAHEPEKLEPLRSLLRELAEMARASHTAT